MNQYVREQFRVDVNKPFRPSKMTREQAKETYPEWYQRVIVEKNKKPKKWDIKSKQGMPFMSGGKGKWTRLEVAIDISF